MGADRQGVEGRGDGTGAAGDFSDTDNVPGGAAVIKEDGAGGRGAGDGDIKGQGRTVSGGGAGAGMAGQGERGRGNGGNGEGRSLRLDGIGAGQVPALHGATAFIVQVHVGRTVDRNDEGAEGIAAEAVDGLPGGAADDPGRAELADEEAIVVVLGELVGLAAVPTFAVVADEDIGTIDHDAVAGVIAAVGGEIASTVERADGGKTLPVPLAGGGIQRPEVHAGLVAGGVIDGELAVIQEQVTGVGVGGAAAGHGVIPAAGIRGGGDQSGAAIHRVVADVETIQGQPIET